MPEEEHENIIDQLFNLLEQLLIPNWNDMIQLLPWVLVVLVALYLLFTARQWRRAAAINRPRVGRVLAGAAIALPAGAEVVPPGVHLPGPSRWPFVVPIGAALLLFALALPPRDDTGTPVAAFNALLLVVGLVVSFVAVAGWLLDAMREWRSAAGVRPTAHVEYAETALAPAVESPARIEPPPGVHMPAPSPWPFFAPLALALMLLGLIFSAAMLVGGIVLGAIAAAGWLLEAGREYRTVEEVGHPVAPTLDPERVWPRRLVPVYAGVAALTFAIALAPYFLSFVSGLAPATPGPSAIAVPAVPEISASTAISFDTGTLIVPCCREFQLVFNNNQAGVPHNVQITQGQGGASLFDGEEFNGVASVTYTVPAIPEGDYYFLCRIHPNMNGTLQVRTETGTPGSSPGPGTSPAPTPQ